jgi:anti-sigma B factor antagonist
MVEAPALEVVVLPRSDAVTLAVSGELDLATCPTLRGCLEGLDTGFPLVTVDLRDVTFMDSTGVAMLLRLVRSLEAEGRTLVVRRPAPLVRRVLLVSGADRLLRIVD